MPRLFRPSLPTIRQHRISPSPLTLVIELRLLRSLFLRDIMTSSPTSPPLQNIPVAIHISPIYLSSRAVRVICPETDKDGSPIIQATGHRGKGGNSRTNTCRYESAGKCLYLDDGSFVSGSRSCPDEAVSTPSNTPPAPSDTVTDQSTSPPGDSGSSTSLAVESTTLKDNSTANNPASSTRIASSHSISQSTSSPSESRSSTTQAVESTTTRAIESTTPDASFLGSSSSRTPTTAIIGATVAAGLSFVILVIIFIWLRKRRRRLRTYPEKHIFDAERTTQERTGHSIMSTAAPTGPAYSRVAPNENGESSTQSENLASSGVEPLPQKRPISFGSHDHSVVTNPDSSHPQVMVNDHEGYGSEILNEIIKREVSLQMQLVLDLGRHDGGPPRYIA
ncbi:hypothetical protein C8J57DRAFT_1232735 [Mycena rebaudengoi]|nr:hypothetical protein C8J57DRAFT_1232735 [Mycena rebaudengoi]